MIILRGLLLLGIVLVGGASGWYLDTQLHVVSPPLFYSIGFFTGILTGGMIFYDRPYNKAHETLLTSLRIARDHEVGLEMIERALEPEFDEQERMEWRVKKPKGVPDDGE